MTLDHHFASSSQVAERHHVTQAARALNLAQSAASHAIAGLEARYDIRSLQPHRPAYRIDGSRRGFPSEARAVLARAERAELVLSEFGALQAADIGRQASQTIASCIGCRVTPVDFRYLHPRHRNSTGRGAIRRRSPQPCRERNSQSWDLSRALSITGILSMAVARDQLVDRRCCAGSSLTSSRYQHRHAARRRVVLRESGSGTRSVFEEVVRNAGSARPSARRSRAAVQRSRSSRRRSGNGRYRIIGFSRCACIEAGLLKQVPFILPERQFHVLSHRERHLSQAAQAFLSMIVCIS